MDELLKDFLAESSEQLDAIDAQLARFERDPADGRIVGNVFLLVHAIKGACGFLDLPRLERVANFAEALIVRLRDGATPGPDDVASVVATVARIRFILEAVAEGHGEPPGDDDLLVSRVDGAPLARSRARAATVARGTTIVGDSELAAAATRPAPRGLGDGDSTRVAVAPLDRLSALAAELVWTRDRLIDVADVGQNPEMRAPLRRLSAVAADLQADARAARLAPASGLFAGLADHVDRIARDLDKKAGLRVRGGEFALDRGVIDSLRGPLSRLVRNAVVHGVEIPGKRRLRGKPEVGVVEVSIEEDAGGARIEVADDGGGLDAGALRERAFALGLASRERLAGLSGSDLLRLPFTDGVGKTRRDRDEGFGNLAAVHAAVERVGGSVSLASRAGRGATACLRAPPVGATRSAFILRAGEARYALAKTRVEEIVELASDGNRVADAADGTIWLETKDGPAPLLRLREFVDEPASANGGREMGVALVVRDGLDRVALVVDAILELRDVALQPLPPALRHLTTFTGAGVLGDGSVVLVLDPRGVAGASKPAIRDRAESERVVAFRSGGATSRALPGSAVTGVAELSARQVEYSGDGKFLRDGARRMPLFRLDRGARPERRTAAPTIVSLWRGADAIGLLVDEVVPFGDAAPKIEFGNSAAGLVGLAFAGDVAIEIVDPVHLLDGLDMRRPHSGDPQGRALVVEPSEFFRDVVGEALGRLGWAARAVGEWGEALELSASEPRVAIVLVDLEMAEAHAGEVAGLFVEDDSRRPAIVGLAAHGGPAMQTRARKAGMVGAIGRFDRVGLRSALLMASRTEDMAA